MNRWKSTLVAAALLGTSMTALNAPSAVADEGFDPTLTVTRSSDAARAESNLGLRIQQADNEDQIGKIRIALSNDFTLDTDVAGSNAQIGTLNVVLYTTPARTQVTLTGTLHDGNDPSAWTCGSAAQCVIARINLDALVPGAGTIDVPLPITDDGNVYAIEGDLTDTWKSQEAQAIQARLKDLSATIFKSQGGETIFRNPLTAGDRTLTYEFASAEVPGYSEGGKVPNCGPACDIALAAKEYAPSAPGLRTPGNLTATVDPDVDFSWFASTDPNGDPITYSFELDEAATDVGIALSLSDQLTPGVHQWRVIASSTPPGGATDSTPSGLRRLAVLGESNSFVFTDAVGSDQLFVSPEAGAFVYLESQMHGGAEYGRMRDSLGDPAGTIIHNESFVLSAVYDGATGTAAGTFSTGLNAVPRTFTDPGSE